MNDERDTGERLINVVAYSHPIFLPALYARAECMRVRLFYELGTHNTDREREAALKIDEDPGAARTAKRERLNNLCTHTHS